MKRTIQLSLVLIILFAMLACQRRNSAQQTAALQQTAAAATLQALVAQGGAQPPQGGQQPSQGGQQPSEGGQQPSQGGQQPSEGGGEPPVIVPAGDQADLVVSKVELSETSPEPNQTIQVKVTIENRGPKAARNFQWGVIPTYSVVGPNNPLGGETVSLLNAGVAKVYQVEVVYPSAGVYILRAVADLNNAINDPDRNNNLRDINVGVAGTIPPVLNQKPKADLKVTNVTASNLTPNVNEEITLSATVFNGGPEAVKNLTWGIIPTYLPNALINHANTGVIAQLNPNDDTFISTRTSYSLAGTYTVKVVADYQNAVDDPHAGGAELQIKVGGGNVLVPGGTNADVSIRALTVNPSSPAIGQQSVIYAIIDNLGPDSVSNLDWAIYPTYVAGSADNPMGTGVIASLAPHSNQEVTYNFTYPTIGTMAVHMVIDAQHKITDPNTGNNIKDTQARVVESRPPAPRECAITRVSQTEATMYFMWPLGDRSLLEGFRIYEDTKGLIAQVTAAGSVVIKNLTPGARYHFSVVSYKGTFESDPQVCDSTVTTLAQ